MIDDVFMTQIQPANGIHQRPPKLPLAGLIALGTAGFITIMTEALPAGILPSMSADLGVSEAAAGQTVTLYAIGSALAAVPLTAATIRWPRRRLLLIAVAGFAVANSITAISTNYALTMAARFVAGIVAGLLWALLAGYARRMVAPAQRGKAMAIAMAGIPVALSVGVPAGTFLANVVGWRFTFGIMTFLTLALVGWICATVPSFPGSQKTDRLSLGQVLRMPGVAAVLLVTLTFALAHNILYTYIAPFLTHFGLGERIDVVLLVFGMTSLLSIWLIGIFIDRRLRMSMIISCVLFGVAAILLAIFAAQGWLVYVAISLWGLAFGGAATLLQTASAEVSGEAGDVAQSLIVTCWNIGIAGGGIFGGLLLSAVGPTILPQVVLVLVLPAMIITAASRRHGFPSQSRRLSRHEAQRLNFNSETELSSVSRAE